MKRKSCLFGIVVVLAVAGSLLVINRFVTSLPDWAIRTAGVILVAGLVVMGFLIARLLSGEKGTE